MKEAAPPSKPHVITLRAVGLGLASVLLISFIFPFFQYTMASSMLGADHFHIGALFLVFFYLILFNVVLARWRPSGRLTPQEFILPLVMGMAASGLTTNGMGAPFISTLMAPHLLATPENQWAAYFYPYLKPYATVTNEGNALTWLVDGVPPGASIPWSVWGVPLFWWLTLIIPLIFMAFCCAVILRRQWVEHEKLVFPIMQIPLTFARGMNTEKGIPDFLTDKRFWIGFSIPFGVMMYNMIGYFTPIVPQFPYFGSAPPIIFGEGFPGIDINFRPEILGISYFVNLDVLAGFWFFYMLGIMQVGVANRIGYVIPGQDNYTSINPMLDWQNMGAFVVFVGWALWRARFHIKNVIAKAFGRAPGVDDSDEMLSYRVAVFGFLIGFVYIVVWLNQLGMSLPIACFLLAGVFVIYIGVSRIVSEAGLPFVRSPMTSQVLVYYSVGSVNMSMQTMTAIAQTYGPLSEIKSTFMPAFVQSGKLAEIGQRWHRGLGWAMLASAVIGVVVSLVWTLYLGFDQGTRQFTNGWWFGRIGSTIPYDETLVKARNPFGPDVERLTFFGIGGTLMFLFMSLRARMPRWPLHPLGFMLSYSWPARAIVSSMFICWLIKNVMMWVGGIELYRKGQPFFLGLIFGVATGVMIVMAVDYIWFPHNGHQIYGID
ncbi:MAG: hypothetical protein FJY97_13530 [candidate division Zixibacteria bacterium]|nr:hypothetical protein [candidate division Zixibacteria bacterium]